MRDPLLVEREQTHGNFERTALISQQIKDIMRDYFDRLDSVQCEALDMIAVKIARILSGDAGCREHWEDLIGYARLGLEDGAPDHPAAGHAAESRTDSANPLTDKGS